MQNRNDNVERPPRKNRAPSLTLIALISVTGALLLPDYSLFFWLVAAVSSLAAAYYAAQLHPRGAKRSSLVSSILFTLLGLAIGLILINTIG
jgi:hypothetical protein